MHVLELFKKKLNSIEVFCIGFFTMNIITQQLYMKMILVYYLEL